MGIGKLINYYRECFKEDTADFNLRNLLALKSEDLLVIKGEDALASGDLPRLPIAPTIGERLLKRSEIYKRERVLIYGSLFITGKLPTDNGKVTFFSPIVFNEANIECDEYGYYLTADPESAVVNEELISFLLPEQPIPQVDLQRLYNPSMWANILENSVFNIDCLESLHFPKLADKENINKALKRKHPSLLPLSCIALIERSVGSRGVLHELETLSERERFSSPISELLEGLTSAKGSVSANHKQIPGTLSNAQKKVISSAANSPVSIVSGPPGTGKSYTIAATAVESFTRDQTVLITASSEAALDVIAKKLEQDFGLSNLIVRVGHKSLMKDFKEYLNNLLAGYYDHSKASETDTLRSRLKKSIAQIIATERQLEALCKKAFKSSARTHRIRTNSASIWDKATNWISTRSATGDQGLWQTTDRFFEKVEQKEQIAIEYLTSKKAQVIESLLQTDRKAIQMLNKASRARTSSKQSEYFSGVDFSVLLQGFPVWLVSLNTLHKVLPLQTELFDLVIIDEATQCNIANAIPALARGKRALIAGDQKQLKHYSFLSRAKQTEFKRKFEVLNCDAALDYRESSILDLALSTISSQKHVAFLDEHYRSQPEIINFSNKHFYDDRLKIMQHRPCSTNGHINVINVDGIRDNLGVNHIEASALLACVHDLIATDKETGLARSIGVLSPFSKQVAHLIDAIGKQINADDVERHDIRVATPYGFQGEERDIMLLSMAIDNNSRRAASYLNKPDVFNVAVSRARQKQYVFKSIDELGLPPNNLLRQYIQSHYAFTTLHKEECQPDEFQLQVTKTLEQHGLQCWKGYEMLGTYVDILVRGEKHYMIIDLIGYPGPWQDHFELNSYKVIKRAGMDVFPLSYHLWLTNKPLCVDAIVSRLKGTIGAH